jgi:hypothetical protein
MKSISSTTETEIDELTEDKEKKNAIITLFSLHGKNWSVVSTLITAQKQCLGKCHLNTLKCLFKGENDTFKCENDTLFIL